MTADQHINTASLVNFRNIAGSLSLYRTAHVHVYRKEDIEFLKEKKITCVVDFRNSEEIQKQDLFELVKSDHEMKYINFPIAGYQGAFRDIHSPSTQDYVHYALRIMTHGAQAFKKFLNLLEVSENERFVFGCHAGKDRTGIMSILIHNILGVSNEVTYQDFMTTNEELQNHAHHFENNWTKRKMSKEEYLQRIRLEETYFDALMLEINRRYGSLELYISNTLNISNDSRAIIAKKYTHHD
ncbi:MAG: tyrosine-protein phosphatase [Bacteroidota bacterium]